MRVETTDLAAASVMQSNGAAPALTPDWLERHRVGLPAPVKREAIVGIGHVMDEIDSIIGRLATRS